jgi:hypothetical protein
MTEEALHSRAVYFSDSIGLAEKQFIQEQTEQFRRLEQHDKYDEIVLWFEHNLFDQTMLIFLLDWFSKNKTLRMKLKLLCIGAFPGIELFMGLGQLTVGQLGCLEGRWHEVTEEEFKLASKAWQAYASDDPTSMERLLLEDSFALAIP